MLKTSFGTCLKLKGGGVCYLCGQDGHIRRNCLVLSQDNSKLKRMLLQQSIGSNRQNQIKRDASTNRTSTNHVVQSNIASSSGTKSKGQVGQPKT